MVTDSPPLARQQAEGSALRCGRCGATQPIDLTAPVLTQVRPFLRAHVPCGPDSVTTGSD